MISVSWDEFFGLVQKLALKLKDEKFDSVICINRGGLVAGRMLSDEFLVPLGVISARAYEVGKAVAHGDVFVDKKVSIAGDAGKKVLLVDDIADKGATFSAVKSFLAGEMGLNVNTAAVFIKKNCSFAVDFYAAEGIDEWLVMPYEVNEFGRGGGK